MIENKKLDLEDLEKIAGGSTPPSDETVYLLLLVMSWATYEYKQWIATAPNSTLEQKHQQAKAIVQKIYNNLNDSLKELIDKYKAERPTEWEEMVKKVADKN